MFKIIVFTYETYWLVLAKKRPNFQNLKTLGPKVNHKTKVIFSHHWKEYVPFYML